MSASSFETEVHAMFAAARAQVRQVAIGWALRVVADVVTSAPGPGNQSRDRVRDYEATGRLRGSFDISLTVATSASRYTEGPYDPDGSATVQRAREALNAFETLPNTFYFTSDVAYAFLVVEGKGPHAHLGVRNFPQDAAIRAPNHLQDEIES